MIAGVISADYMTGYDYRNLMVVCEDMDFTGLCYKLRKKVGYTEQVSMIPMKELPQPNPEQQTTPLQGVQSGSMGPITARGERMMMPVNHNAPMDPLPTIGTPSISMPSSAPSPMDTPLQPMAQGNLSHASTPRQRVHPLNDNFSHASTREHVRSVAPDHHSTHVSTHEHAQSVALERQSTHASIHHRVDSVAPGHHYTYANTPHQHHYSHPPYQNQWSHHSDKYDGSDDQDPGYCFIM